MGDSSVDLKLERNLIDPNFDGYKLSLEPLPQYQVSLESDVDKVLLSDSQYTYQHVKAFGVHNHLHLDPWNTNAAFLIDQGWRVMKAVIGQETNLSPPRVVHQLPDASSLRLLSDRVNTSIHFTAPDWLVLADGAGHLSVINTGNRLQDVKWKVCYHGSVLGEGSRFLVLHSVMHADNEGHHLECLLLHVDKKDDEAESSSTTTFTTVLEWITLVSVDQEKWDIHRTRRLTGVSSPDYAVLESDGQGILVASEKVFTFAYDSVKPVEIPPEKPVKAEAEAPPPVYTWSQTLQEADVQFTVGTNVTKPDILFKLTSDHIELGVKNEDPLLEGTLHQCVDVEGSTWTLDTERHRLELHLEKKEPVMWPTVVQGDERGEYTMDPETVAQIHERLAQFTSDQWDAPGQSGDDPYNAQELEECDAYPKDSSVMLRFDGETHAVTHKVSLSSNQWLFNIQSDGSHLPCLCLRHDVDGIVWQPDGERESGQCPWKHTATFNALGYVQASKQQRKFSTCSPDFSYAVICDCVRHVYIYRQPLPITSPLRNRKTGREVAAIAKQQLISLDSVEDIVGLQATNKRLLILAGKTLYVVKINEDLI